MGRTKRGRDNETHGSGRPLWSSCRRIHPKRFADEVVLVEATLEDGHPRRASVASIQKTLKGGKAFRLVEHFPVFMKWLLDKSTFLR